MEIHSWVTAPRVDAQAGEERTGLGGWALVMNSEGKLDPWLSPWFSYEYWPWIFERGDKPSLIISTLEAPAVLISLKMFFGDGPKQGRTKVQVVPTWTDNRENGSTLNTLTSTKFPSRAAKASVEWAPRSTNCEADAVANGITDSFDPSQRIVVYVKTLRWEILPEALSMGKHIKEDTNMYERAGYQPTEEGNSGDENRRTE